MSKYAINKVADERGIARSTAMLIWEATQDVAEFIAAIEDYAAGRGFVLAY